MPVLTSELMTGRSRTSRILALVVVVAVLCVGGVSAGAAPAHAAGQTLSGTIVFPASARDHDEVRQANKLNPETGEYVGVQMQLRSVHSGLAQYWDLGADPNVSYDEVTGAWAITDIPDGDYILDIGSMLPGGAAVKVPNRSVVVRGSGILIEPTVIPETGKYRSEVWVCGWERGDIVPGFVKNIDSGVVTRLEIKYNDLMSTVDECPKSRGYVEFELPTEGVPAGRYISYTEWNGKTSYYAGHDQYESLNSADALVFELQNWSGGLYKSIVPAQVAAGSVAISGVAQTGQTLTAKTSGWASGATFSYQWLRNGTAIGGATKSTLTLNDSATGAQISVTVAGSKANHWSASKTSAKTVKVTKAIKPAYVPLKQSPFKDVATNHKFYAPISWMFTTGLSTGSASKAGRVYLPKSGVSREAMAAFLYRLEGATYKGPKSSPFTDVKFGDKFYNEMAWMYAEGLSTGVKSPSGREYQPKAIVSREAMGAFIYRLEKASVKGPKTSPFADMKPNSKFYTEIAWMYSAGLSTGMKQPNGTTHYAPKADVSREAMAAFLYRLDTK